MGEVLKHYHPHGDSAVYDALVRMVQDFSLRYPLISGQGNFGSMDGDSAAAYRYTEARLAPIAEEVLRDIDRQTVDFGLNFYLDSEPVLVTEAVDLDPQDRPIRYGATCFAGARVQLTVTPEPAS